MIVEPMLGGSTGPKPLDHAVRTGMSTNQVFDRQRHTRTHDRVPDAFLGYHRRSGSVFRPAADVILFIISGMLKRGPFDTDTHTGTTVPKKHVRTQEHVSILKRGFTHPKE